MRGGESPRRRDSLHGSANWTHSLGLRMHPFVFWSSIYLRHWMPVWRSQIALTPVVMVSGAINLLSAYVRSLTREREGSQPWRRKKAGACRIVVQVRNNLDRGGALGTAGLVAFGHPSSITSLARRGAQIVTLTASYQRFRYILFVCSRSQAPPRIRHST
jgi:hypothetical protein